MVVKNCLVTGASGFIGRTLCEKLQTSGCSVRALVRHSCAGPWDDAILCDLGVEPIPPDTLANIDTVFHLAGRAHAISTPAEQEAYQQDNVDSTRNLISAAAKANIQRFIYFSTVKAIDFIENNDFSLYAESKYVAEQLVLSCNTIPHVAVIRPALVYGPGHRGNFERMTYAIAKGRFPPLPDTGNKRSMVDVRDLADAALLAATNPAAHKRCFTVTDGHAYSTHELYLAILDALGKNTPKWSVPLWLLKFGAMAGDLVESILARPAPLNTSTLEKLTGSAWYDSEPLFRELGFEPKYTFQDSVKAMVEGFGLNYPTKRQ